MPKLQESGGNWSVYIPGVIVKKKQWKKGQEVIVSFNERGNVEITDTK